MLTGPWATEGSRTSPPASEEKGAGRLFLSLSQKRSDLLLIWELRSNVNVTGRNVSACMEYLSSPIGIKGNGS